MLQKQRLAGAWWPENQDKARAREDGRQSPIARLAPPAMRYGVFGPDRSGGRKIRAEGKAGISGRNGKVALKRITQLGCPRSRPLGGAAMAGYIQCAGTQT
jgi:hypothetical protein